MSKRNVSFTKPEEPSFLKRIKQQIGYKEGPTVDTKRENFGPAEDLSDGEEEQPTVVVLNAGDLTAEEVQREQQRIEKEAAEVPADLNSPIVFKVPNKSSKRSGGEGSGDTQNRKKSKKLKNKTLLSFDEEENDDLF